MHFQDYQNNSKITAFYPIIGHRVIYPVLGLSGEVGEVTEKIKKIFRDKEGVFGPDDILAITKELGDVLWYLTQISTELGISLDDVASKNLEKLRLRQENNKLSGSGDDR